MKRLVVSSTKVLCLMAFIMIMLGGTVFSQHRQMPTPCPQAEGPSRDLCICKNNCPAGQCKSTLVHDPAALTGRKYKITYKCVECVQDSDCPKTGLCDLKAGSKTQNTCITCSKDRDCPKRVYSGYVGSYPAGTCRNMKCYKGACVECVENSDCGFHSDAPKCSSNKCDQSNPVKGSC